MKYKKILITGIAGFIGSNLAERLMGEGHDVVGIDNLVYGREDQIPKGVDFRKLDIRSKDIHGAFKGVEIVFHLAAKNDLTACQEDPVDSMDINVRGTANVFEAARRAKVERIIFSSSSALEEGEARLKGFYAISKTAGEKIAEGYYAAFGLPYVIPRYFNVYGPRQDYRRAHPPLMSSFIIKALRGEAPTLYEGDEENKRDFIYVDDINDFHLMCLDSNAADGKIVRLGTGSPKSVKEVWEAVQNIAKTSMTPIIKPREPGNVMVSPRADLREATKLGWKPKTSLEEGLRLQWEYLKNEVAKGNIT